MSNVGLTASGKPCQNCVRVGGFCAQHAAQASASPVARPTTSVVTGGTSPAIEAHRQIVARKQEGEHVPTSGYTDVLHQMRLIMREEMQSTQASLAFLHKSVEEMEEEMRRTKQRLLEREALEEERAEMARAWNERTAKLIESIPEEVKAQQKARFAQQVQAIATGQDLETHLKQHNARDFFLKDRRSPYRWHGEARRFSYGGAVDVLILPNDNPYGIFDNNPALLIEGPQGKIVGRLEGGIPHCLIAELDYSNRYRASKEERMKVAQLDADGARGGMGRRADEVLNDLIRIDQKYGIATGDKARDLRESIAALA